MLAETRTESESSGSRRRRRVWVWALAVAVLIAVAAGVTLLTVHLLHKPTESVSTTAAPVSAQSKAQTKTQTAKITVAQTTAQPLAQSTAQSTIQTTTGSVAQTTSGTALQTTPQTTTGSTLLRTTTRNSVAQTTPQTTTGSTPLQSTRSTAVQFMAAQRQESNEKQPQSVEQPLVVLLIGDRASHEQRHQPLLFISSLRYSIEFYKQKGIDAANIKVINGQSFNQKDFQTFTDKLNRPQDEFHGYGFPDDTYYTHPQHYKYGGDAFDKVLADVLNGAKRTDGNMRPVVVEYHGHGSNGGTVHIAGDRHSLQNGNDFAKLFQRVGVSDVLLILKQCYASAFAEQLLQSSFGRDGSKALVTVTADTLSCPRTAQGSELTRIMQPAFRYYEAIIGNCDATVQQFQQWLAVDSNWQTIQMQADIRVPNAPQIRFNDRGKRATMHEFALVQCS